MLATRYPKAKPAVLEKIKDLCHLLWQHKRQYEQLAAALPDKDLSRTILVLAQESHQYACELSAQLQSLGGPPAGEKTKLPGEAIDAKSLRDESAVLRYCKQTEQKTVRTYRKLLRKSGLHEGIREMIRYQLDGLRSTLEQLHLLNAVTFH